MATTEHFYSGTGTQTSFPFQFPYLTESDIFVKLYNSETGEFDLQQQNTSGLNHDYSISNTNIVFNTAPPQVAGIDNIHIYRTTDVEIAKAVYGTGSAIRAQDLNNNTNQALFRLQESDQLITTGDIKNGAITEAKLAPNSVTTVHIRNGTIIDEDVSATAAIQGSKIVPNFGVQNIIGDGSQIINPNPNFGNQTITTDLHITAQGNITAVGDLSVDDITASGDMTINGITAQGDIHARKFCGDGSCLTGITFDGIDQFLRRDIDDTASGTITFNDNIKIPLARNDYVNFPNGRHGDGDSDIFHKGVILWNYPADNTVYDAFESSAWLYLREYQWPFTNTKHPELALQVGNQNATLDPLFSITTGGQSECIYFDKNGTNISGDPLRIHNSSGVQWEFRNGTPSFQINCTSAYGLNPDTYMRNRRGTLYIESNYEVEFIDVGLASNDGTNTFTSTQLIIKNHHDSDDESDLSGNGGYNGGHVELYSNNTKRFETDIFGCVVHSNIRIPSVSFNDTNAWNYNIIDDNTYDNGLLIFGDKPNRSATSPSTPMDGNNWFWHNTHTSALGENTNTTTFQLGAVASSQVPRGVFAIQGNDTNLVTFSKKEKSGTKFDAPAEIGYSNLANPDVDEGSSLKWGLHSLYGATPTPSLEIRCKNPSGNPGYRHSYITALRDNLYIQAGGLNTGLIIEDRASTPNTIAKFISDNSGDQTSGDALYGGAVELYAEGTKRFETNHTGGKVYGTLEATGTGGIVSGFKVPDSPNVSGASSYGVISVGNSNDLEIYHDSSHSYIVNDTGDLYIQPDSIRDGIILKNNGRVGLCYGGTEKFKTTSTGAEVTGRLDVTGDIRIPNATGKIQLNTNLTIYRDNNHGYIDHAIGALKIRSDTLRINDLTNDHSMIHADADGAVKLYYDHVKKFETTSTGAEVTGDLTVTGGAVIGGNATFATDGYLTTTTGITIENSQPGIIFSDTTANPDFIIQNRDGSFAIRDITNAANRFLVSMSNGDVTATGNVNVTGNIEIPNDTGKILLGESQDLELYHDGSNSVVKDAGTGMLKLLGTTIAIKNHNDNKTSATFVPNTAVSLFYDGSKKFETTSTGTLVTGIATATQLGGSAGFKVPDNLAVSNETTTHGMFIAGTGNDLYIFHNGTDSVIENTTGNLLINAKSSEEGIKVIPDGAVELYFDGSKKFETENTGVKCRGDFSFCGTSDNEHIRFDAGSDHLKFEDNIKAKFGSNSDLQIFHDGSNSIIRDSGAGNLLIEATSGGDTGINVISNNAVELYYDNAKKFETTSTGVSITGHLSLADHVSGTGKIKLGDSNDLQLYHNGTDSYITNATGNLNFQHGTETLMQLESDGPVKLFHDDDLKFQTNTSGCRFIGTLAGIDNDKVALGTSNDLQIYHDGTNSYINDTSTALDITGNVVRIRKAGTTENMISCTADGAVVQYYAGTNKWQTTSAGWKSNDNVKGVFGNGADLQIYHSGTHSFIRHVATATGNLYIDAQGTKNILIRSGDGNTGQQAAVVCYDAGKVALYYNGENKLETSNTGTTTNGIATATGAGTVGFKVPDNPAIANEFTTHGMFIAGDGDDLQITHYDNHSYINNKTGNLYIQCNTDGDVGGDIHIRAKEGENSISCLDDGLVRLYYDNVLTFSTASNGTRGYGNSHIFEGAGSAHLQLKTTNTGSSTCKLTMMGARTSSTSTAINQIDFCTNDASGSSNNYDNSMPLGDISVYKQTSHTNIGRLKIHLNTANGSNLSTVFDLESDGDLTITGSLSDGSDRRLKTDIVTISDALTKVNNLRGVEYTKIASGKKEIGVIAQEVQTVFPELVRTGDDEDKTLGVQYGHLTAALIEAVKELTTEVNTLKTKVAALEAA